MKYGDDDHLRSFRIDIGHHISYSNWGWCASQKGANAMLHCWFNVITRKLRQELDVVDTITATQLFVANNLEYPPFGRTPRLSCRELALVVVLADELLRLAL